MMLNARSVSVYTCNFNNVELNSALMANLTPLDFCWPITIGEMQLAVS